MIRYVVIPAALWLASCSPGNETDAAMDVEEDAFVMPATPPPPAFLADEPDREDRGVATNLTQAKAGEFELPSLFKTNAGRLAGTPGEWRDERRPEIMEMLAAQQFGRTPDVDVRVAFDVWDSGVPAYDGKAIRKQATINLSNDHGEAAIDVVTYTPANADGPSPVLLSVLFNPVVLSVEDEGVKAVDGWITTDGDPRRVPAAEARAFGKTDVAAYMDAGIGLALVYYGQIEPDFAGGAPLGVRALTGAEANAERTSDEWGSIGAWSWGVSRIIDYLESDLAVDSRRIALMGFSRLGKTALWAAAQDLRIAAVIDCCSGLGGQSLFRRNYGETIAHITAPGSYGYWFAPAFADYADDPERAAFDAHFLLAALAPRPVLLINGHQDSWADPYGAFLAARAASPAWTVLGGEGLGQEAPFPQLDTHAGDDLRYFIHDGGHGSAPADQAAILDFLTAKLGD